MSEFLFDQKIQMDVCCIGCILTSTNTQAAEPDDRVGTIGVKLKQFLLNSLPTFPSSMNEEKPFKTEKTCWHGQ